ncbi:MAG: hypothetical protein WAM85_19600 [Terracidiphilus sp.]
MLSCKIRCLAIGVVSLFAAGVTWSEKAELLPPPTLSAAQIVEQMQVHNQARNEALKNYRSLRHYAVQYKGFPSSFEATMDVEVAYDADSGKSFRIISQSGSKFLCNKVLKRAVDSEEEASKDKSSTALTTANYKFQLAGNENLAGRPTYILDVVPIADSKFLYRGRIWVDATDFAVAKIAAEPARNPSLWISRTQINSTSAKTGDFWFPDQNRSETKVRIGGTAVLTINYGTYKVQREEVSATAGVETSR